MEDTKSNLISQDDLEQKSAPNQILEHSFISLNQSKVKAYSNQALKGKLNSEVGYFYPTDYIKPSNYKDDNMDSLSSLGIYNQLMFGLR